MLSALSVAPKELVPGMYWWATNKLWYLNSKPAIERINHRELLEVIMHRIIALEPDYLYGGPYRFFGIFYSRIPGVEISQSKNYHAHDEDNIFNGSFAARANEPVTLT